MFHVQTSAMVCKNKRFTLSQASTVKPSSAGRVALQILNSASTAVPARGQTRGRAGTRTRVCRVAQGRGTTQYTRRLGTSGKFLRTSNGLSIAAPAGARARPARSAHARERPQEEGDAREGGPTEVLRPNSAPLRALGRWRRGEPAIGACGHGSIAPVPSSPARVLGDHHRGMIHGSKLEGGNEIRYSARQ